MEEICIVRQRTKIHLKQNKEEMMVVSAKLYIFVLQNFEVTGLIPIEFKVVSAYNFEKHAGSIQKHPSNQIYLENGNYLGEVFNGCKNARLKTLEEIIKSAISSPEKHFNICTNCKEPLCSSRTTKTGPFCESCMSLDESLASPSRVVLSSASKSGFNPSTVILCDQCEKEYHVDCLRDHKMADLKELPKGKWFCCSECGYIHTALQKLVARGSEKLSDSLLKVIKKKQEAKYPNDGADFDVRWSVLTGKMAIPESKLLLSKAVTIFHHQFDPIVDAKSGRDIFPSMVHGKNIGDQEFGGMYCAVLTANSTVGSAGILQILGQDTTEIPLVATTSDNQGREYFQSLFSCIERFLGFLNVKTIILPSAEESKSIWTDKFGFSMFPQIRKCLRDIRKVLAYISITVRVS